jgi:hypothetical protein
MWIVQFGLAFGGELVVADITIHAPGNGRERMPKCSPARALLLHSTQYGLDIHCVSWRFREVRKQGKANHGS